MIQIYANLTKAKITLKLFYINLSLPPHFNVMVNWENEFKRFFVKKIKELTGKEIPLENIQAIKINFDLDVFSLTIKELGHIYALAIMKENFEEAKKFAEHLSERGYDIKIETDDVKRIGSIDIYKKPRTRRKTKNKKPVVSIPMKIYPDGMVVDFDKHDDL